MHMVALWHTKVRWLFCERVGMKIWEGFLSLSWENQGRYCTGTQNPFPSHLPTNFPHASFLITRGKCTFSLLGNSAASWIWSTILSCVPREERNRRGHYLGNLCQRHHCIWGQKSHKNCQFKIPVAGNRENFSSCELQSSEILLLYTSSVCHFYNLLPFGARIRLILYRYVRFETRLKSKYDMDVDLWIANSQRCFVSVVAPVCFWEGLSQLLQTWVSWVLQKWHQTSM